MTGYTEPLPPGSCKHRPISNGWGAGWSSERGSLPTSSWCGYCKADIEHDAEWIAKFAAAGKRVEPMGDPYAA